METINDEKNNQTSCTVSPVSKSVMIDSISINLGMPVDKKVTEKCHHFSIRGYVADMRKKDVRICAPFALDGADESMLRKQLAPLHVPKCWRCNTKCENDASAGKGRASPQGAEVGAATGHHPGPSSCDGPNFHLET